MDHSRHIPVRLVRSLREATQRLAIIYERKLAALEALKIAAPPSLFRQIVEKNYFA